MKLFLNGKSLNAPDFLIVGAAKSGTTSLAFFLKQHPQVAMPRKEPGFFSFYNRPEEEIPAGIRDRQIYKLDDYINLYKTVSATKKICDSSVAYLTHYKHTIENIKSLYGNRSNDIKFVIILRQPIERAFSHYLMFVKNQLEDLPFEEAIKPENVALRIHEQSGYDYLGNSMYYERVKAFVENFPQVKIYLTEDLKKSNLLEDFLDYLELEKGHKINTQVKLNPSGIPKNGSMIKALHGRNKVKQAMKRLLPDKLQYYLIASKSALMERSIERVELDKDLKVQLTQKHFLQDIEQLQNLLQRDLSHWL